MPKLIPFATDFWGYCNRCGNAIVHATRYNEDDFFTEECTKCHKIVKVKIGASQGEIIKSGKEA